MKIEQIKEERYHRCQLCDNYAELMYIRNDNIQMYFHGTNFQICKECTNEILNKFSKPQKITGRELDLTP